MGSRRYRRITPTHNCKPQGYQLSMIALMVSLLVTALLFFLGHTIILTSYLAQAILVLYIIDFICFISLMFFWSQREEVSTLSIPTMSHKSKKLAKKVKKLFNDKMITDVLNLSNSTRYGNEMPEIIAWVNHNLSDGYIAIENI